ncbi:insulin-degrading enzyme [Folsomia candida]|uniref:insulin-degrading enzyme n=1 Tax=Folsomia candida TaxID=158441 RepID=UPI001604F762|nr:insulin-degrading enzyme [Folsomia candida]
MGQQMSRPFRGGVKRPAADMLGESVESPPIIKSPLDKREYRGLTLDNKMRVILISDSLTDKAAVSLSVAAGSMSDPARLPGLAHLCERMIVLGTEKYPEEEDYAGFLAENGGASNAYTARDHTNYYFHVSPHSLPGALDRFAQFFVTPLFTESAMERVVDQIDSEFMGLSCCDHWRLDRVETGTTTLRHPYSFLETGTRWTLWTRPRDMEIDVRSALMDFHKTYYSANLMSLVVLGSETLDELQRLVEDRFLEVDNRDVEAPFWKESPYGADQLQVYLQVVPVKEVRQLHLIFPTPDTTPHYKASAEGYLSHLIRHEGRGSLMSLLKEKNWVNHLEAGSHVPARGFGIFKIAVDLTDEGLQNTDNIVESVFQYLQMLQEHGPQLWVWEEMKDVSAMLFRFKEKERPQSLVSRLSSIMHSYPLEDVLSAGYILTEYKPSLIKEILDALTPENVRVIVVSKEFEDNPIYHEAWYGVKYNYDKIEPETIQKWRNCGRNDRLKMPSKNEFIPSVFDLKKREEQFSESRTKGIIPKIIQNTPLSRVWFLQDNEFLVPKAVVRAEIFSPLPLIEPLNANLNHMLVALIKDLLTEYSYAASVAGLHYVIADSVYGLEIAINGYDHKIGLLIEKIFERLVDLEVDPKRFEVLKDFYIRSLKSWEDEQPYSHASYYFTHLLCEKAWSNEDLLSAMDDVTAEKLKSFAKNFISKVKIEWLIHGNCTSEEALNTELLRRFVRKERNSFTHCVTNISTSRD